MSLENWEAFFFLQFQIHINYRKVFLFSKIFHISFYVLKFTFFCDFTWNEIFLIQFNKVCFFSSQYHFFKSYFFPIGNLPLSLYTGKSFSENVSRHINLLPTEECFTKNWKFHPSLATVKHSAQNIFIIIFMQRTSVFLSKYFNYVHVETVFVKRRCEKKILLTNTVYIIYAYDW